MGAHEGAGEATRPAVRPLASSPSLGCRGVLLFPCCPLHRRHHKEAVTCCAWFPDSTRFVSGSVDRTLALLDCNGERNRWPHALHLPLGHLFCQRGARRPCLVRGPAPAWGRRQRKARSAGARAWRAGRELQRFKRAYRVQDLAVTAGGTVLVIAASDKHIHILRSVEPLVGAGRKQEGPPECLWPLGALLAKSTSREVCPVPSLPPAAAAG